MKKNKFIPLVEVLCPKCNTIMVVSNSNKSKSKYYTSYKCPKCKHLHQEYED